MIDERVIENLARLGRHPEHEAFRRYLVEQRDKLRDQLETARGEAIPLIQGQLITLRELTDAMRYAQTAVDRQRG